MKNTYLSNLTSEERRAAFKAAQEERERIIQRAIRNGASVHYMTSHLTLEEQETHIYTNITGECVIDTTNPADMRCCIRRGWKITSVTYYQDNHQIAGMTFKGKSNGISIRNVQH